MLGAVDLVQPNAAPQLFESGAVDMLSTDPATVVVSAIGSYSCADVWLSRPEGTRVNHYISIFGRLGDARVLLAEIQADELTYTTDGGREGALALSVRGRPCSALEVECAPKSESFGGIHVFLQAWHADVPHEATSGPERVVNVKQGQAATAGGRWPVYLSTGSTVQGAVNTPLYVRLSDGAAAMGTRPTYSRGASLTVPASSTSPFVLGALWNGSTSKRVEVQRIQITHWGASTTGALSIRAQRISAAPLAAGGGAATPLTAQKHDLADANPSAAFYSGTAAVTFTNDVFAAVLKPNDAGSFDWSAGEGRKPIVLRSGQPEGLEIRAVADVAMGSEKRFGINVEWIEI